MNVVQPRLSESYLSEPRLSECRVVGGNFLNEQFTVQQDVKSDMSHLTLYFTSHLLGAKLLKMFGAIIGDIISDIIGDIIFTFSRPIPFFQRKNHLQSFEVFTYPNSSLASFSFYSVNTSLTLNRYSEFDKSLSLYFVYCFISKMSFVLLF